MQGVPRQDSGGCERKRESRGKGRCEEVLQQEGVQLDSGVDCLEVKGGVDCLEVKEGGHGRSSSHRPPFTRH